MVNAYRVPVPTLTIEEFEKQWAEISDEIAQAFRMSEEQASFLRKKSIARLIAAIPFAAGCEHPARTAVAHLGTYLLSVRETKHFFNATPADDGSIFDRLALISCFSGGDQRVIRKGMSLLALNMLNDYRRDQEVDRCVGKYNPVAAGAFDYESERIALQKNVDDVESPLLDAVVSKSGDGSGTEGYWWID